MKKGFTLIELSIVLVIIALVTGGILAGRELIKQSEIRAIISQKDQFTLAINQFRLKYNHLPGDIPPDKAAAMGLQSFTGINAGKMGYGDNNSQINSGGEGWCMHECGLLWAHLATAGLITIGDISDMVFDTTNHMYAGRLPDDAMTYMPYSKNFNAYWGISELSELDLHYQGPTTKGKNAFYLTQDSSVSGNYHIYPTLSPIVSFGIDSKIDDGKPATGNMLIHTYQVEAVYDTWFDVTPQEEICVYGQMTQAEALYNLNPNTGGNDISCQPIFVIN